MSEVKWIKIATDIFDNWKIKQIKAMPEGYKMICIWFQLLCLCGKCNESGLIVLSGKVVANDELLSNIFGEDLKIVQMALKTFEYFGMIEISVEGVTKVSNWSEYQNTDGLDKIREYERLRKAKQRERKKELVVEQPQPQIEEHGFSQSKSNLDNLRSIMNTYENQSYLMDYPNLLSCIEGWMEYKDQKKPKPTNHYDSERGMKGFLNKVVTQAQKYGIEKVTNVINDSIANNYQGVTWDRLEKSNRNQRDVFDEWRDA